MINMSFRGQAWLGTLMEPDVWDGGLWLDSADAIPMGRQLSVTAAFQGATRQEHACPLPHTHVGSRPCPVTCAGPEIYTLPVNIPTYLHGHSTMSASQHYMDSVVHRLIILWPLRKSHTSSNGTQEATVCDAFHNGVGAITNTIFILLLLGVLFSTREMGWVKLWEWKSGHIWFYFLSKAAFPNPILVDRWTAHAFAPTQLPVGI